MVTLRPYQNELIEKVFTEWETHNKVLMQLACGGGKTKTAIEIIKRFKSSIFMVDTMELLEQAAKTYAEAGLEYGYIASGFKYDPRLKHHVAMVQTFANRVEDGIYEPGLLVVDECFPMGTLIEGIPIEDLRPGDKVSSYNHKTLNQELKTVLATRRIKCRTIAEIKFSNGQTLIATPNHPVYVDNMGYIPINKLNVGCQVWYHREHVVRQNKENEISLHQLQDRIFFSRQSQAFRQCSSRKVRAIQKIKKNLLRAGVFPGLFINQNEKKESYAVSQNKRESQGKINCNETQAANPGREWETVATNTNSFSKGIRMGNGSLYCHKKKTFRTRISHLLQNRHRKQGAKNRHRSRWLFSRVAREAKARQEERSIFKKLRVEDIKIYEQGRHPEFKHLCPEGFVYNLEVEDNNNYFANGVLVHNCHLACANSYQKIINTLTKPVYDTGWKGYIEPVTKLLGLTATPQRLDGKALNIVMDTMVSGPSMKWLIENKYLAEYKVFGPPSQLDLKGIKKSMGDYAIDELADRMSGASIVGNAIAEYKKHLDGKQCLVFAVNVRHSKEIAAKFILAGISAAHVDGETPKEERKRIIQDYRDRKIMVLCNVQLYTKGADFPECNGIISLRPTQSLVLYIQSTCRALRPKADGSKAIILDHAGNFIRHGLPDDDRHWSLDGIEKEDGEKGMGIKTCPECFAVIKQTLRECPFCNHLFASEVVKKITVKEGELVEVKGNQGPVLKPLTRWSKDFWDEVRKANNVRDLQTVALRCGFKKGFGWMLYQAFKIRKQAIPTIGYVKMNME